MQKNWRIAKPNPTLQKELSKALDVSELIAQVLINRNIKDQEQAEIFLDCNIRTLHDPFLLKDMDKAVSRIETAVKKGEKITIWGDYDVDGITSVALLKNILQEIGAYVTCYIPHRIDEGFGLNLAGVSAIHRSKTNLVLTVDCGITNFTEVDYLKKHNIDTIITDHHQPQAGSVPDAYAVINPLQKDCAYPFKHLAGVGLAFKLACALCAKIKGLQKQLAFEHLDLVSLGIISDIAPMLGENRILAKHGLSKLSDTKKEGLKALKRMTGIENKSLSAMHAGYILGPRINACGRIGSAEDSLKLILSNSPGEAEQFAKRLNEDNKARQKLERQTLNEALARVDREVNFKSHRVIVLYQDDWHPGVIGIVASKIVDRFYRPVIMLSFKEHVGKGSGRSIENFHLFHALRECSDFLEKFGGHSKACGLSIRKENLERFKEAINSQAKEVLTSDDLRPTLNIDAEVSLKELTQKSIAQLQKLQPFGLGNREPVFCTEAVTIKSQPRVVGRDTAKMWVYKDNLCYEAIGFRMGQELVSLKAGETIDIAYTPSINQWQGESFIQLELKGTKA